MAMRWESTDQFGNMYIGASEARSVEALMEDLIDLLNQLRLKATALPQISIDIAYGEISGPCPDPVSYVLNCRWLQDRIANGESKAELMSEIKALIESLPQSSGFTVRGPWD